MNTSNPIQYKIMQQFSEITVHELYKSLNQQTTTYDLYNDIRRTFIPLSNQLNRQLQIELLINLSAMYPMQPMAPSQISKSLDI